MKVLLAIALLVQDNGKKVTNHAIKNAKVNGATDTEIHETVMITALFCFNNRYIDGLGTYAPSDNNYYTEMTVKLKETDYYRPKKAMKF